MVSAISNYQFNNFEILQEVKHQLCINAPCLHHEPERTRIFEMLLCKREAITSATASSNSESIAIQFDSHKLPLEKLFILVDTILANIGYKINSTLQTIKSNTSSIIQTNHEASYVINGMSCESCAISLEMTINRYFKITTAYVDFKSSTLKIYGNFPCLDVTNCIRNAGFEIAIQ